MMAMDLTTGDEEDEEEEDDDDDDDDLDKVVSVRNVSSRVRCLSPAPAADAAADAAAASEYNG